MGSIPLPALDVKAQQQPDLLSKFGQLMQLRNMQTQQNIQQQEAPLRMQALQQGVQTGQLQLQQQQQLLKNQQAMTQAYQKWDGKDYGELAHLALAAGANGDAIQKIQQHALDVKAKYSQIAKDDAATGASNISTLMKKNDVVSGALSTVLQVPDDQLPQALTSTATQLQQQGLLDPQHVQMAQQIAQSGDPAKIRQQLDIMRKGMLSDTQLLTEAKDQETARHNKAMELHEQETIPLANQATKIYAIPEDQRTAAQKLFIKGYEKNNEVTRIQPAAARVSMYMQMPQAVVDPNDPSREIFTTKKEALGMEAPASGAAAGARKVLTSAIGGKLGDTINAYNTASAHLDMLSQAADALNNGNIQALNKVGNEFNKQTGSPAPTNFKAVEDAVAGEVSKTFKGGQATDAEIKQAEDAISAASSPAQLKGVINTYKGLMASKRDAIRQQVQQGQQGKVNYGEQPTSPAPASHAFSIGAWHQANPNGDVNAAKAAAQQQGYQVVP